MNCKATTAAGEPCQANALKENEYCFIHAPETLEARSQARKRGGHNRFTPHFADPSELPADVRTIEDANKILSYTLAEVIGMDNSIGRAKLLLSIYDSLLKSFEIGELEARIAALEGKLAPAR